MCVYVCVCVSLTEVFLETAVASFNVNKERRTSPVWNDLLQSEWKTDHTPCLSHTPPQPTLPGCVDKCI